jgi:hypothetical protein
MELSSSQLIIKLLYKELTDSTTKQSLLSTKIFSESCVYEDPVLPSKWTKVASKDLYNSDKPTSLETCQTCQPISVTNRYSTLANLSDNMACNDGITSPEIEKITWHSTNNFKRRKEHWSTAKPLINHRSRLSAQQPSSSDYREASNPVRNSYSDLKPNYIPNIVNGQIKSLKNNVSVFGLDGKVIYVQNVLRESTMKLLIKKNSFSNCHKHKVLLLGNSHIRGCAANMKTFLNEQFEIFGIVKPGSDFMSLMNSAKCDIQKLTKDDILIICSGTSELERNDSRNVFNVISKFVKSVNHTNIIVLSVPLRYDLRDSSCVNNEIKSFNRKLFKFTKIFSQVRVLEIDNSRLFFTKHGLHLNG